MTEQIIVESLMIVWAVSFVAGFILGFILRLSLLIHGMIGAFMLGSSIGQAGLGHLTKMLVQGWLIGVIVVLGMLPGYPCGYFIAHTLCKSIEARMAI